MEKLLSPPPAETIEQTVVNDAVVDADFLKDLGFDVETRETTLAELREIYGARIFRYGQYSGTVADMEAMCPAFGEKLEQGTAAAMAWLEANDQPEQLLDDDEELESPDDDAKLTQDAEQVADKKPQQDESDSNAQPPKEYLPVVTPNKPDNNYETETLIPKLFVVPEKRAYTNDVQAIYEPEQVQEASIATEVDSSIRLSSIEPQETSESEDTVTLHAATTEQVASKFVDIASAETMQHESVVELAVERQEFGPAEAPVLQQSQETELSHEEGAVNVDEPKLLDESYSIPAILPKESEHIIGTDTAKDNSEAVESNYWYADESPEDTEQSAEEVFLDAFEADETFADEPSGVERSAAFVSEAPSALSEIIAMELEENDTTAPEVVAEITQILSELTEQPPNSELETNVTEVYHRVAVVMHAMENLEKARSKEQCTAALEELRTALVELLLQLGYEDAELTARRMLRQYDIATIKKYIATMMRTFLTVRAKETNPMSLTSKIQMPYHLYGAHAVRMVVNLVA